VSDAAVCDSEADDRDSEGGDRPPSMLDRFFIDVESTVALSMLTII